MFKHVFINRLKILLHNKELIFWTLFFPIALGTFFYFAFSNLSSSESFKVVNVAIVDNEKYQNNDSFKTMIETISKEDDNQVFNVTYTNLDGAKKLLANGKISGYLEVKDKIEITVKGNGLSQSIIKNVVDNYYQISSTIDHLVAFNPEIIKSGILNNLDMNQNYFKDISNENTDATVVYFYTLIGMVCLYGGLWGIQTVNETEANLTKQGARINVSPVRKSSVLLSSLLVAFLIQYLELIIILCYLIFVLGIDFGNQIGYIFLLSLVGSLAGISLGTFIGIAFKKSENVKIGILMAISMTGTFLAGMMIIDVKYLIAKNIPILANINPVNLITDALYSLYYYPTHERFFTNIIYLLIFILVMCTLSYLFARRKKYDSI